MDQLLIHKATRVVGWLAGWLAGENIFKLQDAALFSLKYKIAYNENTQVKSEYSKSVLDYSSYSTTGYTHTHTLQPHNEEKLFTEFEIMQNYTKCKKQQVRVPNILFKHQLLLDDVI